MGFDELPDQAQKRIKDIITKNGFADLDVHKLDIRVIPFYGNDLKNRYKEIQAALLSGLRLPPLTRAAW